MSNTHRSPDSTSFIAKAWAWIVTVALLVSDSLIWVMLRTRSNERRIRPTKRVTWPKGLKQELMRRQDNTCTYCGYRRIAASMDIDHIIPLSRGGADKFYNLQLLCRTCNLKKGGKTNEEFGLEDDAPWYDGIPINAGTVGLAFIITAIILSVSGV